MAVKEILQYCTKNPCYQAGEKLNRVAFLVVHSPAVIKASGYPSDVIITGDQWYTRWNRGEVEKLAHGVVDTDGVHRFAPDTLACWHIGNSYGNGNSLGFEFCEYTDLEKARQVYQVGVEYYAELCKKYELKESDIYGHYEAYTKGWASNHSDPKPYFATIGKTMGDFRADVKRCLSGADTGAESGNLGTNTAGTAVPEATVVKSYDPWAYAKVIGLTAADPRLNVRTAPGAEAPKLAAWPELAAGNEVDVLELYSNGWAKINIQGNRGFVNAVYLDISGDGVIAVRTASVANCTALNVRKTPNGAVLAVLKAGTSVTIIGSGKDPDGDVWYLIKANGAAGYVWPKYIK